MSVHIASKLNEWAGDGEDERSEFARELASAISTPGSHGVWGLLDIRREFETRAGAKASESPWLKVARVGLMAGYLAPIGFTWLELRQAVSAFARYAGSTPDSADVNLLSFWAGARNAYHGTTLQTTGLWIVIMVVLLIAGQVIVGIFDEFAAEDESLPNDLILQAQLHLARSRAMTPQEVTEAVSAAANQLESALGKVATVVETATNLVNVIAGASRTLDGSSEKMGDVADKLGDVLVPLADLSETLKDTNESMVQTGRAITSVKDQIDDAGKSLMVIARAGTDVTTAMGQINSQATSLLDEIRQTSRSISDAGALLNRANEGNSVVADQLAQLGVQLRSHEPHLLTMLKIAEDLKSTSIGIESSVQEVKRAVQDFASINNGIEAALRDLEQRS